MKKNTALSVLFFFFWVLGCAPTKNEAVTYHNELTALQIRATQQMKKMNHLFDKRQSDSLEMTRKEALIFLQNTRDNLKKIEPLSGKEEPLRKACSNYLKVLQSLLQEEYAEQVRIYLLPEDQYTEKEKARFDALNEQIDQKYFPAYDAFATAQEAFARKWEIKLNQ